MVPSVSVIVPNYNHARFLDQRLESILNQTFDDFEVLLLDDCSTDTSLEILRDYAKHSKVRCLETNSRNSGSPFAQWSKGLELARGEFIWIAESDDFADLNFLNTLTPSLKSDPNATIAYSRSEIVNEHGELTNPGKFNCDAMDKHRWHSDYTNSGQNEIQEYGRYMNTIPNASSALFRRTAALDIRFPVEMRFAGDWLIWLQLLSKGEIHYNHQTLNYFRCHSNTTRAAF